MRQLAQESSTAAGDFEDAKAIGEPQTLAH
jgi:hypothetical protein